MKFEKGDIIEIIKGTGNYSKGQRYSIIYLCPEDKGFPFRTYDDNEDYNCPSPQYFKLVKRANMKDKNCITLNGLTHELPNEDWSEVKIVMGVGSNSKELHINAVVKQEEIIRVPGCINIRENDEGEHTLYVSDSRYLYINDGEYFIYEGCQILDKPPMKLVETTFGELEEGDIFTCGLSYLVDMDDYNVKVNNEMSIYSLEDDVSSTKFEEDRIVYKVVKID